MSRKGEKLERLVRISRFWEVCEMLEFPIYYEIYCWSDGGLFNERDI